MADPFSIGAGVVGLGFDIYGGIEAMGAEKKMADIQQQEIGVEQQQNQTRRQAMEMSGQRQILQQVRNNQMARSMAQATATSQGAQFGSGLQGAMGSISGQTGSNIGSISEGLQFGEQMFNLDDKLSGLKQQYASAQGNLSSAQGIMSIGSGIMGLGKLL
jgi:hypothetical protein